MSGIEKRGWEDELNAAWTEVNKARRELAGAVTALRAADRLANAITLQCDRDDVLEFAAEYEKARTPTRERTS